MRQIGREYSPSFDCLKFRLRCSNNVHCIDRIVCIHTELYIRSLKVQSKINSKVVEEKARKNFNSDKHTKCEFW